MNLNQEPKRHFSGGIISNPVYEYHTPSPEFELTDYFTSKSTEGDEVLEKPQEVVSNYVPIDVLPSVTNNSTRKNSEMKEKEAEESSIEASRTATTRSAPKTVESIHKIDAEIEKLPVQRSIAEATKKRIRRPPQRDDLGYVEHPQPKRRNSVQRKKSAEKETKKAEVKVIVPPAITEEATKPELNMDDINALCPAVSTFDDSMEPPAYEEPKTDSESEWEESGDENPAENANKRDDTETSTIQSKKIDTSKPVTETLLDQISKDSEVQEKSTIALPEKTEPKATRKAPVKRTRKKAAPKTETTKKPSQRVRKTPIIIPPPEPVLDQSSTQTEVSFEQILDSFNNIIKFQKSIGLLDDGPEDPTRKVI